MIIANTVVLAMAYPGMSDQYALDLYYANVVFTFIFLAEMIIKVSSVVLVPLHHSLKDMVDDCAEASGILL